MKNAIHIALISSLLFAACKKDEKIPELPSTGTVEFNGQAHQAQFSYCGNQVGNPEYFTIGGYSESGNFSCYAYFNGTPAPAASSYSLISDTSGLSAGHATILIYHFVKNEGIFNYASSEGTLEVNQENGNLSVNFTNAKFEEVDGQTDDITASGNLSCE
jgi:hypothetical protein